MSRAHSQRQLRITLTTVLIIIISLSLSRSFYAKGQDENYYRTFKWTYEGYEWTWSLEIPKSLYDSYKNVPVSTRTRDGLAGYGFLTTTNDPYLKIVAEKLQESALEKNYEPYDQVSFVLAFIQSLPYTSDIVTSRYDEYPRFPIETLVDNGGDCEDTSILFATLTLIMGYGTVYINPPDHYAVGILGDTLTGYYFTYNGGTYYYCETTGDGFQIGEVPNEYENVEAYLYQINTNQQYNPLTRTDPSEGNSNFFGSWGTYSSLQKLMLIGIGAFILAIILIVLTTSGKRKTQNRPSITYTESLSNQILFLEKLSLQAP